MLSSVCCPRAAPHSLQNFATTRLGAPHAAHGSGRGFPQESQNLAASEFSQSQLGHRIIHMTRRYGNTTTMVFFHAAALRTSSDYSRKAANKAPAKCPLKALSGPKRSLYAGQNHAAFSSPLASVVRWMRRPHHARRGMRQIVVACRAEWLDSTRRARRPPHRARLVNAPKTIANSTVSTNALTNLLLNSMKLPVALRTNTIIAAIKTGSSACIAPPWFSADGRLGYPDERPLIA